MLLTVVTVFLLIVAWLAVYTHMGIIPEGAWKRIYDRVLRVFGVERTTYTTETKKFDGHVNEEEETVFHDVFELMDAMNVSAVESFKAYGHRTFYFTCGRCRQKNRLGTDIKKFKSAGCGKCHTKFAKTNAKADPSVNVPSSKTSDTRAN